MLQVLTNHQSEIFQSTIMATLWKKALWLDVESHETSLNQSLECIIPEYNNDYTLDATSLVNSLHWKKALWLDVASHETSFNQSLECIFHLQLQ